MPEIAHLRVPESDNDGWEEGLYMFGAVGAHGGGECGHYVESGDHLGNETQRWQTQSVSIHTIAITAITSLLCMYHY